MHLAPTHRAHRIRAALDDERGFTLVEVLVAMVAGTIVAAATLAIVIGSVHLSSNYQDRVDSNQQGRLAMERITQALNSSCISSSPIVTPVLAGSSPSSIIFYSSQSDSPTILPNQITIGIQGNAPGPLVMTTQPLSGNANNGWSTSGTATNFTLVQYAAGGTIGGSSQALFQYYQYNPIGVPSLIPLSAGSTLTSAQAQSVVMVTINLQALPADNWNALGRAADFTDSVVLRLSPASTAAGASNLPCT